MSSSTNRLWLPMITSVFTSKPSMGSHVRPFMIPPRRGRMNSVAVGDVSRVSSTNLFDSRASGTD